MSGIAIVGTGMWAPRLADAAGRGEFAALGAVLQALEAHAEAVG